VANRDVTGYATALLGKCAVLRILKPANDGTVAIVSAGRLAVPLGGWLLAR